MNLNSEEISQVIKASLEKVTIILEKFGWLELFPYKYALELSKAHKQGGEDAIWNIIIDDSKNAEFLDNLVKETDGTNILKDRSHIISRALEHHKNKDYVSSVPLLLSQIEGIVWDLGIENR